MATPTNQSLLANADQTTDDNSQEVQIPLDEFSDILGKDDIQQISDSTRLSSEHFENLVDYIDDGDYLNSLGQEVLERFERDRATREPLESTLISGFNGLNPSTSGQSNLPFDGACEIVHPLIRENAAKYQAKFCSALLPPQGPFAIDITDITIPGIEQRAAKYNRDLNRIARDKMNFGGEQARLFLYMSLTGTGFKKVYYDAVKGYPVSDFVKIEDFVVSDLAKDLMSAVSYSHLILRSCNELKKDIATGLYCDVIDELMISKPEEDDLGSATNDAMDAPEVSSMTEVYTLIEQYVDLDLGEYDIKVEDVDYAVPYIITVEKNSGTVLSIRRNWNEDDAYRLKIVNFFDYTMVPSTGYYGLGLFHLLGDFQKTLTAITRSLVDSASFANLQAGFKRKGIRWSGPTTALKPGEFRDVELLDNTKLADVLMPINFKEPSQTLFQLQRSLTSDGQQFADSLDEMVNNPGASYGKTGTTMALMEQSSEFFASIFARVYSQMQKELCYIAELCEDHLGPEFQADFNGDGILELTPASDPNYSTRTFRIQMAQQQVQFAMQAPQVHNLREAFRAYYQSLGEPDEIIAKILPDPQQAQPLDPVSDIQAASNGIPIKAFEGQDHDGHIQIKSAFVMDPTNQNPVMQNTVNALQANIKEHIVLKYVESMNGLTNASGDPNQQQQQMQQGASIVAQQQAAQKVLQANQMVAQQQATGQAGGPLQISAQADMIKAQAAQDKVASDTKTKSVDLVIKAGKLDLDREKETNRSVEALTKLHLDGTKNASDHKTDVLGLVRDGLSNKMDHSIKTQQFLQTPPNRQ